MENKFFTVAKSYIDFPQISTVRYDEEKNKFYVRLRHPRTGREFDAVATPMMKLPTPTACYDPNVFHFPIVVFDEDEDFCYETPEIRGMSVEGKVIWYSSAWASKTNTLNEAIALLEKKANKPLRRHTVSLEEAEATWFKDRAWEKEIYK